ncbi:hypothetical protein KCU61_g6128, partial [Aureobasidium melanogenum]
MNLASILQHPIEEIQTSPPRHSSSTSTSPILSPHAGCGVVKPSKSTTKRTQTKAACLGCRQRKSKCDGDRPSCRMCLERGSKCEYSVEEGKTQQQATKEQLRSYKDVLSLLRNSSPKESEAILHILKNMDLNDACRFILDGPVFVPNR